MGIFVSEIYSRDISADPDLPRAEERKLRKRVQNRLNQRARTEQSSTLTPKTERKSPITSESSLKRHLNLDSNTQLEAESTITPRARYTSPTTDQLLHLIQYNAFRGLYSNKVTLGTKAIAWSPEGIPEPFDVRFPAFSVVLPVAPGLPENLEPIESQIYQAHSSWISTIPFPEMRRAFIRNETLFSHAEFMNDVIGNLLNPENFTSLPDSSQVLRPKSHLLVSGDANDELTAHRNGLIVWGEPHLVESWEATPGFLQKWAWALEGCEKLIESTNRWRGIRGEEPVHLLYAP
ncbi:hypothetical protein N7492_002497 [Penicillium capsulatum]|uniref:Uncharacterized protein n=1 Tax=Penicillium capsulatum TaxID=69766 RepID=A0A9W9LWH6_9EURO|nr:hypothetical protein N7492_002497 [Penicillium capsulatum]KAJ6122899.1 hypothetical protein N7512_005364 [Penicillium capsulatum]